MKPAQIRDRLSRIVGDGVDVGESGHVVVCPSTETGCAAVLKTAYNAGWTIYFAGNGIDRLQDIPADIVLSTSKLNAICDLQPADLFATAQAGATINHLQSKFAESGLWMAADPPGTDSTIGAMAATGGSGSLQTGFGPLRDQILGLTLITPAGRVIAGGGRVVKNVAGYDIPKLVVGSYGAFGLISKVHLRLRVAPQSDLTLVTGGTIPELLALKRKVETSAVPLAAAEIHGTNSRSWTMAVRLIGSPGTTERRRAKLNQILRSSWQTLDGAAASDRWNGVRPRAGQDMVTVRLGPTAATLEWTVDQLQQLGNGSTTIYGARHVVRWSGEARSGTIARLRFSAAEHAVPLTIEDGPWPLLAALGRFGDMRPGVLALMNGLRSVFDPHATLVVPLHSLPAVASK